MELAQIQNAHAGVDRLVEDQALLLLLDGGEVLVEDDVAVVYDRLGVEFSSTRKLREEFVKRVQMDPDYTPPLSSKKECYSDSEGSAEEETVESVVDEKGFHSLK